MDWKALAKQALVSAAVVYAYHSGVLDFIPVFKGPKKS